MNYQKILLALEPYMENTDAEMIARYVKQLESGDKSLALPARLHQVALGITYHEACVLHMIYGKDKSYGIYANKALTTVEEARKTAKPEVLPIIDCYITASKALIASRNQNLLLLAKVIRSYNQLVKRYSDSLYLPLFLRGSLLENLPNLFGAHRRAVDDFNAILSYHKNDPHYCPQKIIGFCNSSIAKLS